MSFLASAVLAGSSNSSSLNDVEPGVLGFLVVAGIGVALVFLLRSMNKQFRKLGPPPQEFEDGDEPSSAADEADTPDGEIVDGEIVDDDEPTKPAADRRRR